MTTEHPTGGLLSPPDHRDYKVARSSSVVLPRSVSWAVMLQPVRNQGGEGTCVGHAVASSVMGHYEFKTGWHRILAPRDAYEGARSLEPVVGEGAYIRAALAWSQKQGICLEEDRPYSPGNPTQPDGDAAYHRAENKVAAYARVDTTPEAVKQALVSGPLVVMIPTTASFNACPNGRAHWDNGANLGYHAVALVGYDDSQGSYRLRNSWGTAWGDAGDCWLSYAWPLAEVWAVNHAITKTPAPPAQPKPWWQWW